MLKPLKQFICDECNQVINTPKEGYVEWESGFDEKDKPFSRGFRIVHIPPSSPYKHNPEGCYKYGKSRYRSDIDLESFLKSAHQEMFSRLDKGRFLDPTNSEGCKISNFREFVEFFRRLTVPYYEEARLYFQQAWEDGFISTEMSDKDLYSEEYLKKIVEKYSIY